MTPAQLKQLRQRLSQRKNRPHRAVLPRMREPNDLAYRYDLLLVARRAQRTIRDELEPWLKQRLDASDGDDLKALFARIRLKVEQTVDRTASKIAGQFVKQAANDNMRDMNAQYKSVLKIEPFASNSKLAPVMRARVSENVDLIRSIPTELLDQVEAVVTPTVKSGLRVEDLMQRMKERFDVSDSRAQLIARDQVGKFNAELAAERAKGLGVDSYVWSTSKDQRVRTDHRHLEGTVQRYDAPPIVDEKTGRRANPGEDFQCRCQALPRVSALLDALGVPDDIEVEDDF